MFERPLKSWRTRATVKLLPKSAAASSVCMLSSPMLVGPARPESRAPAMIGISSPFSPIPMRRLKNTSASPELPTAKSPAFSRKNGRFSGKNRLKRSRFTCCSSTSTWAKSVLTVASSVRLGVTLYLASRPTSPKNFVSRLDAPRCLASPSVYGMSARFRWTGSVEPGQRARERHPHQVELNRQGRPESGLVPPPNGPLKVHAPLAAAARLVAQRLERDLELRRPAVFGGHRSHFPGAVPIQIEAAAGAADLPSAAAATSAAASERAVVALSDHLAVVFECGRRGREHESILAIAIGVQNDAKAVSVVERGVAA